MMLFLRSLASAAARAFETLICLASVATLVLLAAAPAYEARLPFHVEAWQWALAFSLTCAVAVAASWTRGIFDKRLPSRIGGEPRHSHISGWTFIWIVIGVVGVVALAQWAATSSANMRAVNRDWGVAVLLILLLVFVAAALMPALDLEKRSAGVVSAIGRGVRPFGRALSIVDSILVFAVAGAAGATQASTLIRYITLFGTLGACGVIGYWLAAPWGLVPIAWGVIIALAISRRWAWIEGDRELAMLNRRFVGPHLRIGFTQDLRDEALLSFASLLVLAPLAFRQAQIWALGAHVDLFDVDMARAQDLRTWFAFFGTQLAGALPFVQWAGVYNVGGADSDIVTSVAARHIEFAIECVVDLVLLAALLQALAISARNAAQRGLFYEGQLDRLDPFIEPIEFRKLMRRTDAGAWEPDPELVTKFPRYDPIRLSEFVGDQRNPTLRRIANAIRVQQGGSNVTEFHAELVRRAEAPVRDRAALVEVMHAIRAAGSERPIAPLNTAREALNGVPNLVEARTLLMQLIVEAPASQARTQALAGALDAKRDNLGSVRIVALRALAEAATRGDEAAIAMLHDVADAKQSTRAERRDARAIVKQLSGRVPLIAPAVATATSEPVQADRAPVAPSPAIEDATVEDVPPQTVSAPVDPPPLPAARVEAQAAEVRPARTYVEPPTEKSGNRSGALFGLAAVAVVLVIAALAVLLQPLPASQVAENSGTTATVAIPSQPVARETQTPAPPVEARAPPTPASPPAPTPPAPVRPVAAPPATVAADSGVGPHCPSAPITQATVVTVRQGDTLSKIARECYRGERSLRPIANCNAFLFARNLAGVSLLSGEDLLYVGDRLTLPAPNGACPS